jgi:hypothetical protein
MTANSSADAPIVMPRRKRSPRQRRGKAECGHRLVEDRILSVLDEVHTASGKMPILPAAARDVIVDG